MRQKTSTIAPLHDLLVRHLEVSKSFGSTNNGACASFAKAHGLHDNSVYLYAKQHNLIKLKGTNAGMEALWPDLLRHLEQGGDQLDFARANQVDKSAICRLARRKGWACHLISASEWTLIQQLRRGRAAE